MGIQFYQFADHPSLKGREEKFTVAVANVQAVMESWKSSLFSHEWLDNRGELKPEAQMSTKVRDKRMEIEAFLNSSEVIPRPVLGLGILDNVEIGAGKEIFLLLAGKGFSQIEVHVPATQIKELQGFLVDLEKRA